MRCRGNDCGLYGRGECLCYRPGPCWMCGRPEGAFTGDEDLDLYLLMVAHDHSDCPLCGAWGPSPWHYGIDPRTLDPGECYPYTVCKCQVTP